MACPFYSSHGDLVPSVSILRGGGIYVGDEIVGAHAGIGAVSRDRESSYKSYEASPASCPSAKALTGANAHTCKFPKFSAIATEKPKAAHRGKREHVQHHKRLC